MLEVEKLRREPYDCENPDHEEMLMKVLIPLQIFIAKTANLKRKDKYSIYLCEKRFHKGRSTLFVIIQVLPQLRLGRLTMMIVIH